MKRLQAPKIGPLPHNVIGGILSVCLVMTAVLLTSCGKSSTPPSRKPAAETTTTATTVRPPTAASATASSATVGAATATTATAAAEQLKEKWGIQVQSIKRAAGGYMVDFRYRVIDPKKALPLFNPRVKSLLLDQASGAQLGVPSLPKISPTRTVKPPQTGKTYSVLFANPGKLVKPGNRVTVVIGDLRAENLTVQQ